jgi:hypothetical protein
MARDWHEWYEEYDDPESSLSHRLLEVRRRLAAVLDEGDAPIRLLSLCSGDGRDTIPLLAASDREVDACLVELDPDFADGARRAAARSGVELEVRTGDAGAVETFADRLPVDVLMLCGVFGNVSDDDIRRTVGAVRSMLRPGGTVVWTRGSREPDDPALWVRELFTVHGYDELAFVVPEDATYRVGVVRLREPSSEALPERLFAFVG